MNETHDPPSKRPAARLSYPQQVALIRHLMSLDTALHEAPEADRPTVVQVASAASRELGFPVSINHVYYYVQQGAARPWWPRQSPNQRLNAGRDKLQRRITALEAKVEALEAAFLRAIQPPTPR